MSFGVSSRRSSWHSENVTGAGNQQERLFIEAIPTDLGSFLSGFALGEASFMLVCRRRGDYSRSWKISAAFNVSQKDRAPLDLFRATLDCGTMRRAGNGGWYWEVSDLRDISRRIVPFFERFPLVGAKAEDFSPVQDRGTDPGARKPLGRRLRHRSDSPRRNERRRKETPLDGENPQRLYAELIRWRRVR